MVDRILKIVDPRLGIVKRISSLPPYPIKLHTRVAEKKTLSTFDGKVIIPSSGSGLGYSLTSIQDAEKKAVGEALERYCAQYFDSNNVVVGSFNELTHLNRMDPLSVTKYQDWQYKIDGFKYSKVDRDTIFTWVKGIDHFTSNEIWIPTCLVYLYGDYRNVIRDILSTGLAAGSSKQQAFEGGVLECIERDAIMIMWLNELSVPSIDNKTIDDVIVKEAISMCEKMNLKIIIKDISTDILIPTYFVIIVNNNGFPHIVVAAKTHYNYRKALRGAVEEAFAIFNQLYQIHIEKGLHEIDYLDLNKATIEDHLIYYALGNGFDNLKFLFKGKIVSLENNLENKLDSFESLMNRLKDLKLNIYSVDLSTEDINHLDLHVVRIVMPDLAFMEFSYPMLNCKRLSEVPITMGYKKKENFNTNPHPFP